MQLKLTWRAKGQRDMDLLVSDGQKITETMEILAQRGLLDEEAAESARYVKSLRTKKQVNVLFTYSEADIYSGDILEMIGEPEDINEEEEGI